MAQTETESESESESDKRVGDESTRPHPFAATLKVLAVMIPLGALALHVLGFAYHRTYANYFGYSSSQFPQPLELVMINGYYIALDALVKAVNFLRGHLWWMAAGVVVFAAVVTGLVVFVLRLERTAHVRHAKEWLAARKPIWLFVFGLSVLHYGRVAVAIFLAPIAAAAVLFMPALIGEKAGAAQAEADMQDYAKGCAQRSKAPACVEIMRNGNLVLKGFMIDDSETHLAVFDGEKQQLRIMERSGKELSVNWLPVGSANQAQQNR